MTKEPADFALKGADSQRILHWVGADPWAPGAIKLDAANTGQSVYVLDAAAEPVEPEAELELEL
jgi:hypothetical protein